MPFIACDIRIGRTPEQKSRLARALTQAVHEVTGVPIESIFITIRELPGFNFVEGGEHVPEYVPGPGGQDISRQLRTQT
jgi:4-oxalocrotonate tautomerase family enzyme